jgi:hypothetical protein
VYPANVESFFKLKEQSMDILYFNPGKEKIGNDLLGILESHITAKNIRIYRDMDSFSRKLIEPQKENAIAVILTADEEDLMKLYAVKHLLYKAITILILPDRERDTIAVGFRCKPYFMTFVDYDPDEIGHVIRTLTTQPLRSDTYNTGEEQRFAA